MKKFALSLIVGMAVACTAFAADPVKKPIVMKLGHV